MNRTVTSREAILAVGKEIVIQSGLQALNIRDIAGQCGVSVGSVYNYFPSKSDLIVATAGAVWIDIMHDAKAYVSQLGFAENVQLLFDRIQEGCQKYPSFFSVHSMSIANSYKNKGREAMNQYFDHIKEGLLRSLDQDPQVRPATFSDQFTKSDFVDFTFSNMIALLMKQAKSCNFLLEIVKRTIYGTN